MSALSTAVSGTVSDVIGMIGENLPVIAGIFGVLLAITIVFKLVRKVAK
ncbi:MAG: hypothetical protein PHG84_07160 [Endomicrobiaceae bacterium]|nr:hypothetical protein [Endomicrobiaceae bacterium]MDD3923275.1 hypothetical protein [Endomicrobiaceae bacterium]